MVPKLKGKQRGIVANQNIIDMFLKVYDAGEEITPEILEKLVEGLRPRKKGRPKQIITHIAIFALYQLITAERISELTNRNVRKIRASIASAKKEKWIYCEFQNNVDEKGKSVPHQKWNEGEKSRQIWLDNGKESLHFAFTIKNNKLKIQYSKS